MSRVKCTLIAPLTFIHQRAQGVPRHTGKQLRSEKSSPLALGYYSPLTAKVKKAPKKQLEAINSIFIK